MRRQNDVKQTKKQDASGSSHDSNYIDGRTWHNVVPGTYVNRDWLCAGDDILNGRKVEDQSSSVSLDDMRRAATLLDARRHIIGTIDSRLRRDLFPSHVWYSDSQQTFIADFPRPVGYSGIESDFRDLDAALQVIAPVFNIDVIRDCPLVSVKHLIMAFDKALHDAHTVVESDYPEFKVSDVNDQYWRGEGQWFVTVIIDEDDEACFDVIVAKDSMAAESICYEVCPVQRYYIDSFVVLGPYLSEKEAKCAEEYYRSISASIPLEELLDTLRDVHEAIVDHRFKDVI